MTSHFSSLLIFYFKQICKILQIIQSILKQMICWVYSIDFYSGIRSIDSALRQVCWGSGFVTAQHNILSTQWFFTKFRAKILLANILCNNIEIQSPNLLLGCNFPLFLFLICFYKFENLFFPDSKENDVIDELQKKQTSMVMNLKTVVKSKESGAMSGSSGGETAQSDAGDNSKKRKQNAFLVEVQERAEVRNTLYRNSCKLMMT